jgi:hypothetical protein
MSSTPTTNADSAPQPEKPKSLWDSILTSTPVVLTVLATLLAGLSSSEMTRAQYHRSLAAQHQSKVSDQWAFFQAKRIRGGSTEMEAEMLRVQHHLTAASAESITEYVAQLPMDLERVAGASDRLLRALNGIKTDSGNEAVRLAIEKLAQTARQNVEQARALEKRVTQTLAQPEIGEALTYLNSDKLPSVTRQKTGGDNIRAASDAIQAHKTEAETSSLMARVTDNELRDALDTAESNAKVFDDAGKPVEEGLKTLAQLIHEARALTGTVHQLVERVAMGLTEITGSLENSIVKTAGVNDATAELRDAASTLARLDSAMIKYSDEITQSFMAAHRNFTARRLEREARDIQEVGGVYEIQVRKSSWDSERHRSRSQLFFLGMLVAQAGVTIASFSLALKQRNALWALATAAGIAAIGFSAYVYLFR